MTCTCQQPGDEVGCQMHRYSYNWAAFAEQRESIDSIVSERDLLRAQLAKAKAALVFYADHNNWAQIPGKPNVYPIIIEDMRESYGGKRARQTLKDLTQKGPSDE